MKESQEDEERCLDLRWIASSWLQDRRIDRTTDQSSLCHDEAKLRASSSPPEHTGASGRLNEASDAASAV